MTIARLGLVGGTGWLCGAIARAALERGAIDAESLWVSNRSGRNQGYEAWPAITVTTDNAQLAAASETVVLSVLPQDFGGREIDLVGNLAISLMAGVTVERIRDRTGAERIVRAMPNAAAERALSYTPWYADDAVRDDDKAAVRMLFGACGWEDEVEREDDIDYLTAFSGGGPAIPATIAEAMIAHATDHGLAPHVAERAARMTLYGGSALMAENPSSPGDLAQLFVDYAGVTAQAVTALRASGLAKGLADAIEAGYAKARTDMSES